MGNRGRIIGFIFVLGIIVSPLSFHVEWVRVIGEESGFAFDKGITSAFAQGLLVSSIFVMSTENILRELDFAIPRIPASGALTDVVTPLAMCSGGLIIASFVCLMAWGAPMSLGKLDQGAMILQGVLFLASLVVSSVSIMTKPKTTISEQ